MSHQTGSSSACEAPKAAEKPKPCCVCTNEKSARDECLLFNGQDSPKCQDIISRYKACMGGYGFTIA